MKNKCFIPTDRYPILLRCRTVRETIVISPLAFKARHCQLGSTLCQDGLEWFKLVYSTTEQKISRSIQIGKKMCQQCLIPTDLSPISLRCRIIRETINPLAFNARHWQLDSMLCHDGLRPEWLKVKTSILLNKKYLEASRLGKKMCQLVMSHPY